MLNRPTKFKFIKLWRHMTTIAHEDSTRYGDICHPQHTVERRDVATYVADSRLKVKRYPSSFLKTYFLFVFIISQIVLTCNSLTAHKQINLCKTVNPTKFNSRNQHYDWGGKPLLLGACSHLKSHFINQPGVKNSGGGFCSFTISVFIYES